MKLRLHWLLPVLLCQSVQAATISELAETDIREQAWEFITLSQPVVQTVVLGATLLGLCCGLLGSFIVVRRMALIGDALSHAVLPGVALGFLWNMTRDPVAIFVGAVGAGLVGTIVFSAIRGTTKIKEDSALGLVLSGFYGLGIALMGMIQGMDTVAGKSGLDKYLFGQIAALSSADVKLMAVVTAITVLIVVVFYKELLVVSFDRAFAQANGLPEWLVHYTIMLLLAFAIVVALQAVGVVLVSAMLITPAATAYLLTDRFHRMLVYSSLLGILSGLLGAFFSYLGSGLPTGPFMVLGASTVFVAVFLFAGKHGLVPRLWRIRSRRQRIAIENLLKACYQVRESEKFCREAVAVQELHERRAIDEVLFKEHLVLLTKHGYATLESNGTELHLTPKGWMEACRIIRNHRLWELFLTRAADYPADHVHDDAEVIEHVLGAKTVRELERRLNYPAHDPHGKAIPSIQDIESARNSYRGASS